MTIKRLPNWNAAAAQELIAECFEVPAHCALAFAMAERMASVVQTLNAIQPEDHLNLLDEAGLEAPWKVVLSNASAGVEHVLEGEAAREVVWFLDEMWQDAPLAMSPVRYQRLAFRLVEEYLYHPLKESGFRQPSQRFDEFVGDLLSLILGEHRNNYVFSWWQEHHGRFR